jgi:hypothetical protein
VDTSDAQVLAMARHLVERMAPEDLELFEETAPLVLRRAPSDKRREDPLGFGLVDVSAMLFTSIACGVARDVLKSLAEQAGEATAGWIGSWFRGRWRRRSQPQPIVAADAIAVTPLSLELLAEVRGIAQRRAVLLGLPPDRAEILADSVVQYLDRPAGRPA